MLGTARMWLMESQLSQHDVRMHQMTDGGCNGDYVSMLEVVTRLEELLASL